MSEVMRNRVCPTTARQLRTIVKARTKEMGYVAETQAGYDRCNLLDWRLAVAFMAARGWQAGNGTKRQRKLTRRYSRRLRRNVRALALRD